MKLQHPNFGPTWDRVYRDVLAFVSTKSEYQFFKNDAQSQATYKEYTQTTNPFDNEEGFIYRLAIAIRNAALAPFNGEGGSAYGAKNSALEVFLNTYALRITHGQDRIYFRPLSEIVAPPMRLVRAPVVGSPTNTYEPVTAFDVSYQPRAPRHEGGYYMLDFVEPKMRPLGLVVPSGHNVEIAIVKRTQATANPSAELDGCLIDLQLYAPDVETGTVAKLLGAASAATPAA
jgi:hypothetical protein